MKKKVYAVIITLLMTALLLTSAVGCGGGGDGEELSAQQVVAQAQQAASNLESFSFDIEMSTDIEGEAEGAAGKINLYVKSDGIVNLRDEQMKTEMDMRMKGKIEGDTMDEEARMAMYIVEDTMYVGLAEGGGKMSWESQRVPSYVWEQQNPTGGQMKLLEDSQVKLSKSEKVHGIQCYVLELEPDPDTLWRILMQQPGMEEARMGSLQLENVKKMTIKQWFAQDSLYLVKGYVNMELKATPSGAAEDELTMTVEMTMDVGEHNESFHITEPEEAKGS